MKSPPQSTQFAVSVKKVSHAIKCLFLAYLRIQCSKYAIRVLPLTRAIALRNITGIMAAQRLLLALLLMCSSISICLPTPMSLCG